MPTATLAATDIGVHELAIAAATVQTFVITPTGVLQGQTPRVRLFNMGTGLLYVRGGTTVAVGDPGAAMLPPGSVTDFTPSTGTFSVISAAAAVVSVERQPQTDLLRIAGGSSSGGSSTPTLPADVQSTGTLGALNAALAISPGPRDTMVAAVGGTFAGTITLQGSLDGVTWYTMNGAAQWLNVSTGALAAAITVGGLWQTTISAIPFVRVVMTAYTSGSATIVLDATDGNASFALDGPLPAGANTIGAVRFDGTSNGVSMANATETGSLAALNAAAGGGADLTAMGQVTLQVTGTWVGTLTFQVSNDGTNWVTKVLIPSAGGSITSSTGGNGVYSGQIGARYFRVIATAYTSGTAVVTIRYNAAANGAQPSTIAAQLRANAGADALVTTQLDEVVLGAFNGSTIDRVPNATALAGNPLGFQNKALAVASGSAPVTSLSGAAAPTSGTATDNVTARPSHTLQVDVTTTAVGTAGAHAIYLQGSLDGTNWTNLANVAPVSTSTTASDTTNHANASVNGLPYRYIRANWAAIPTGWVGTLTARVVSA